jgi:hypothetical protein
MLEQLPISGTLELTVPSLLHASGEGGPRLDRGPDEVLKTTSSVRRLSVAVEKDRCGV